MKSKQNPIKFPTEEHIQEIILPKCINLITYVNYHSLIPVIMEHAEPHFIFILNAVQPHRPFSLSNDLTAYPVTLSFA